MTDPLATVRALEQELREEAVRLESRGRRSAAERNKEHADKFAACLAALPTQEWQLMNTAPKDETEFLMRYNRHRAIARWNGATWNIGGLDVFGDLSEESPFLEGWMPLPARPADTRKET